jgi:alcohol dehydrogenase class IV
MHYSNDLNFIFYTPTRIIFGEGCLRELPSEISRLSAGKSLLLTDDFLRKRTGLVEKAEKMLGNRCAGIFSDIPSDSGVHVIQNAYEFAKNSGADAVISLGGGSVIDTAKGVALLLREGGNLRDYEGFQILTRKVTPHIAIPTTAGTGSEVTYVAVIKDHERKMKLLFGSEFLVPDTAILDPCLTAGLPPLLTAATGMDAMSHAIEALHSAQREPVADGLALHAVRLLKDSIPRCIKNPSDIAARGIQQIAATMAGSAFSNAQVGLVHAMAHTVGARYNVHHGLANSIFLPHVILFNMDVALDIYFEVARAFGIETSGHTKEEAVVKLASDLKAFSASLGLVTRLRDADVPEGALKELSDLTLYDGAIVYNAKPVFDSEEILRVYRAAF